MGSCHTSTYFAVICTLAAHFLGCAARPAPGEEQQQTNTIPALTDGADPTTWHVAKSGNDSAAGSALAPFRSVQRAADAAQPGDTVVVHEGVYREWVRPPRGGTSEATRITYVAAPGEEVVLKGSERITGWVSQGGGVWRAIVDNSLFGGENPFALPIEDTTTNFNYMTYGQWHHRGDVYLNEMGLVEQPSQEAVSTTDNSWFATVGGVRTYIYANFGSANPNQELAEIAVRKSVFSPAQTGIHYITVRGFSMMQTANSWAPPGPTQYGIISPHWSKYWVIEHNRVSHARSVGILLGFVAGRNSEIWDINTRGFHTVRNNQVRYCGQAGIAGSHGAVVSRIEGNLVEDTNYRKEFGGWETAGIKLHTAVDTVLKGNLIRRVSLPANTSGGAFGIWLDWGNQGPRVTGNAITDVMAHALYLEVSSGPFLVDNNILIGGVNTWSEGIVYAHNLFSGVWAFPYDDRQAYYFTPHTLTKVGEVPVLGNERRWYNNLFFRHGLRRDEAYYTAAKRPGATADYNVYLGGAHRSAHPGWDDHSIEESFDPQLEVEHLPQGIRTRFRVPGSAFNVQRPAITAGFVGQLAIGDSPIVHQGLETHDGTLINVDQDIDNSPRSAQNPKVGPFEGLSSGSNSHTFDLSKTLPNRLYKLDGNSGTTLARLQQIISLPSLAGQSQIRAQLRARADKIRTGSRFRLVARVLDSAGNVTATVRSRDLLRSSDWETLGLTLEIGPGGDVPSGSASLAVSEELSGDGTAYFDDVEVFLLGSAGESSSSLVKDGGFDGKTGASPGAFQFVHSGSYDFAEVVVASELPSFVSPFYTPRQADGTVALANPNSSTQQVSLWRSDTGSSTTLSLSARHGLEHLLTVSAGQSPALHLNPSGNIGATLLTQLNADSGDHRLVAYEPARLSRRLCFPYLSRREFGSVQHARLGLSPESSAPLPIRVHFVNDAGGGYSAEYTLNGPEVIDTVRDAAHPILGGLAGDFGGALIIESLNSGNKLSGAVALHQRGRSGAYAGADCDAGTEELLVPTQYRFKYGSGGHDWHVSSALRVQNVSSTTAQVEVHYDHREDAALNRTIRLELPPKASVGLNTKSNLCAAAYVKLPCTDLPSAGSQIADGWQGSVRIRSTNSEPLVAINTTQWGRHGQSAEMGIYAAIPKSQIHSRFAVTGFSRNISQDSSNFTIAILQNPNATTNSVVTRFYRNSGELVSTITSEIPAQQTVALHGRVNCPDDGCLGLPDDFSGWADVQAQQGLAVVANYVATRGDGDGASATTTVTPADGSPIRFPLTFSP